MSPTPKSILVIGAGELGTQVLRSFATHSNRRATQLTVLLRPSRIASPNNADELTTTLHPLNIDTLASDIATDPESHLTQLFRNYDTIISCTGFAAGPGVQLKLARAVLAAQVPRFIPWQFGVDYDVLGRGSAQELFDEQLDVRALLRSQTATQWVIVSTGMFTSFLFDAGLGVVDARAGVVRALGSWENRVTVTAVEDIGRITVEVVLGGSLRGGFGNQVLKVAGDTLSYGELAGLVKRVTGKEFKREVRTVEAARADLAREPGNGLFKYQVVFGEGKGVAWDLQETWNYQVGLRALTAEEWARKYWVE
ncbi:isoflavone reductase family protein [Aspergillus japonicus CBS 114.51]|uniref:Isoflavone reductase family protein n=1 Tax=Aspergillus japonicus CBS 114.51 TaxID=1448312 RepID=A0A8T8WL45_ASPJA|nr:isoflavone reductase family protein [Aspergillus japonicus CBS 114.51]RAH76575.1 isoflavone reductase family protein [Aspergillus japonicus CBS 114.51]